MGIFYNYTRKIDQKQWKNWKCSHVPRSNCRSAPTQIFSTRYLFFKLCLNFLACRTLLSLIGPFSKSFPKVWKTPFVRNHFRSISLELWWNFFKFSPKVYYFNFFIVFYLLFLYSYRISPKFYQSLEDIIFTFYTTFNKI